MLNLLGGAPELLCFANGTCGVGATGNGSGSNHGSFSAHGGQISSSQNITVRLSAEALRKQAAQAKIAKYADDDSSFSTADLPEAYTQQNWDVWAEFHGSASDNNSIDNDLFAAYFGGHFRISDDVLIGLMTQVDRATSSNATTGGSTKGTGFMFGPYVVAKLPDHPIYFEGRALWGKTYNDISPIGTYTDRATTSRMMLRAKVSGDIRMDNDVIIRPEGYLSYFSDKRATYTDSNGTVIPGQTVALGEARLGPTIYKEITTDNGNLLQPRVGATAVANFAQQNATIGSGGIRARLDSGLNVQTTDGFIFDISAYYDGLFNSGYSAFGGQASLGKSF
jgi:outer membrane autotransporter protein